MRPSDDIRRFKRPLAPLPPSSYLVSSCRTRYSKAKSSRELDMQRKGRRWLLCAAGAIGAYVALSGGEEDDEEDDGGE